MASKNENSGRVILVIVGILVLSALGYFATRYFTQSKKIKEEYIPTIEELNQEVVQLEDNIIRLEATIEDQNLDLSEKDKLLAERDRQLEELEIKLNRYRNSGQASSKQVKQLENRVALLRSQVSNYEEKITTLETLVSQQSDTIASQKEQNLEQAAAINTLEAENVEKAERLRKAGTLRAADFTFFNVRKNGKEKEGKEFRRSGLNSLNELKVCFNILQNSEAKPGPRDVYLVYENPDGTVSSNVNDGYSGKFETEGIERIYSAKASVNYNLTTKEVCIPYSIAKEDKFQKGIQYLSIFVDGNLVGQAPICN